MKKILIRTLMLIMTIFIIESIWINTKTYASLSELLPNDENEDVSLEKIIKDGDDFLAARDRKQVLDEEALSDTSNTIYNILFTIAVVLAFAIGMVIGIQFITGSVDEKAKIKETLVPYVIGVFIVFSAFTIWKIAVGIGNEIAPTPEPIKTPSEGGYSGGSHTF